MRANRGQVVLLALLTTVGLAGCGDDDDESVAAADRRAFVARGEQLCVEFKTQLDRIFEDFLPTLPRRAAAYGQVVPLGRTFSRRFAALRPPDEGRARVARSLRQYRQGLARLERGVAAARDGDVARSNAAFAAAFTAFRRSDGILAAYGFDVCAEPKTERSYFTLPDEAREGFSAEKRAFLAEAESICRPANEQLRPFESAAFGRGIPDLRQWQHFLTEAVPVFQDVVSRLRALPPPVEDRATIAFVLDTYQEALAAAGRAAEAAAAGNQAEFDAAMEEVARFSSTGDQLATRYGFRECRER